MVVVRGEEREGEGDEDLPGLSVGEVGQIRVSLFRVLPRAA